MAVTTALPPSDEPEPLEALRRPAILDTPPEQAFEDLAHLAAQICQVPSEFITLVDEDRQWFKARIGFDDGLEAVDAARQLPNDVILMDCQMPGMDGCGATMEIQQMEGAARHTPIVAMTANAMPGDRERCQGDASGNAGLDADRLDDSILNEVIEFACAGGDDLVRDPAIWAPSVLRPSARDSRSRAAPATCRARRGCSPDWRRRWSRTASGCGRGWRGRPLRPDERYPPVAQVISREAAAPAVTATTMRPARSPASVPSG